MPNNVYTPFPDECLRGYAFRLRSLNGIPSKSYINILPETLTLTGFSALELVRSHCHTAYRRFVSSKYAFKDISTHGDLQTNPLVCSASPPTREAYYCPKCIEDDKENYGISYWRRTHHLPGIKHCLNHKIPLYTTSINCMISRHPQNSGKAELSMPAREYDDYIKCPAIIRFTKLSLAALHTKTSFHPSIMARVITRKILEINPRSLTKLCDLASNNFPKFWLDQNFSEIFRYSFHTAESVITLKNHSIMIRHYLLALSILWDSPEEALNACWFGHLEIETNRCPTPLRK